MDKNEEVKNNSIVENYKKNEGDVAKYELLLKHCQDDCKSQDARKINTDTKTSYMLVFAAFLLGTLLQNSIIQKLFIVKLDLAMLQIIIWFCCLIIYVGAIILCIISIVFYIIVLINRKYTKIDTELFKIEDAENAEYIEILKGLITNYYYITKKNSAVNNKVIRKYGIGTKLLVISLFLIIGLNLLIQFI